MSCKLSWFNFQEIFKIVKRCKYSRVNDDLFGPATSNEGVLTTHDISYLLLMDVLKESVLVTSVGTELLMQWCIRKYEISNYIRKIINCKEQHDCTFTMVQVVCRDYLQRYDCDINHDWLPIKTRIRKNTTQRTTWHNTTHHVTRHQTRVKRWH